MTKFRYEISVQSEWVDYNGHMNDAAYAKVFSLAVDALIDLIGLDASARDAYNYTIFTLETHLCYLKEAHENEKLHIEMQLLDSDSKRLHVFFSMKDSEGELVATSEQMLMGMDVELSKPAPFPEPIETVIDKWRNTQKDLAKPKQAGRTIAIKR